MSDEKKDRSGRGQRNRTPEGQGGPRGGGAKGGKGATRGGSKAGGKQGGQQGGKQGGRPAKPRSGRDQDDTVAQLAGPLQSVLKRLPATQREVLEWRMGLKDGHPTPIGETAKHLGLTLHEAKEIEQRAFEHIREVVPLDRLQKLLKG